MHGGVPINRQLIFVLKNGTLVLDWGGGKAVDLLNSEFVAYEESDYSHAIRDEELDTLRRAGRVTGYDHRQVFVVSLPEPPHATV